MTQTMTETLQLIPGKADGSRPAFSSDREYEQFRREFAEAVRPDLDRYRIARQKSEESARHHRVN